MRYLIQCQRYYDESESMVIPLIRTLLACALLSVAVTACAARDAAYRYEVRVGGAAPDTVDREGAIDLDGFLAVFHEYPWAEAVSQLGEDVGPSLKTIQTGGDRHAFFVSVVGDSEHWNYVVGVVYPREVPLENRSDEHDGSRETTVLRWAEVVVVKPPELVALYATKFFSSDLSLLLEAMRKAPLFLDVPASELAHIGEG